MEGKYVTVDEMKVLIEIYNSIVYTTLLHKIQSIKKTKQLTVSAFIKPSSGCNLKGP